MDVSFESGSRCSNIGEFAFQYCDQLRGICIPSRVDRIPTGCFGFCRCLSRVAFESGCRVSSLGERAFDSCSSLRVIHIPPSVEWISLTCFRDCSDLFMIVLQAGSRLSAETLSHLRSTCNVSPGESRSKRSKSARPERTTCNLA
jgi:hypothetical protein